MIRNFDNLSAEQKKEWIASLQVGDEVVFKRSSSGYGGTTTYRIVKVHSVTKTGRVNVMVNDVRHTFTKDGRYYGNRGDTWSRVSYQLRQIDEVFHNHRRKVIGEAIFEESMKKLENSYKELKTVEDIERYAYVIDKALRELKL